jgi:hypothetical protein
LLLAQLLCVGGAQQPRNKDTAGAKCEANYRFNQPCIMLSALTNDPRRDRTLLHESLLLGSEKFPPFFSRVCKERDTTFIIYGFFVCLLH